MAEDTFDEMDMTGEDVSLDGMIDDIEAGLSDEDRVLVEEMSEELREDDRRYAMTLAALRRALDLTQTEVARRAGVSQPQISDSEHRGDMLISTLRSYVSGLGLSVRIVVVVPGQGEVEIDLDALVDGRAA